MATVGNPKPNGTVVSYADSAASDHCFVRWENFVTYSLCSGHEGKMATKGGMFNVPGTGSVKKSTIFNGEHVELTSENVLHTPALSHNL
ncbi:hypothetical protein L208DRAFT_1310750, partial [Tricholoma matsutake]